MRTIQKRHLDAQRRIPAGECVLCGGELYPGEAHWRIWGRILCADCVGLWPALQPTRPGEVRP